jgi:HK97 family phage major capsid protein
MPEPTNNEIMEAVTLLRADAEKGMLAPEVKERLNTVLDQHEDSNQKIVAAQESAKAASDELVIVKEELESKGAKITEITETLETLERELARKGSQAPMDPAAYRETPEFKALQDFVAKGDNASVESKALLRTDSAVDGGVLVTTEMDSQITKKITEIDNIRSVARVRSIGSKSIELAIRNTIPVATYEGEAETGDDSASTYENETVTPFRQTFTTPITQDQLQDAAFDMESEITSDAGEAFAFGEGNGFVLGSGHKVPEGFIANATLQAAARVTAASGILDPEALILLTGDLKVGYDPTYVLNRRTLAFIRTMKATTGQFLWMPGMNGPVASTLNGFPYILANSMPEHDTNGAYSVAFGDFRRGYTIVDRTGMSIIRDNVTRKKKAIVEFTMNRWNTGRVTLPEAIKLLQIKA